MRVRAKSRRHWQIDGRVSLLPAAAFEEPQRVGSDDGFEFTLQDIQIFEAVVANGLATVGGLAT
jgi:hypothetical protein